ncbi:MAG: helix-turn-helix domain-containing protein [Stagnimonas sp.]|nr:helix-turn-helix domain-containing protein [Stagnimonas sp.]
MALPGEILKPLIPNVYGLLTVEVALALGADRVAMTDGIIRPPDMLNDSSKRISHLQWGRLLVRALKLTQRPEIGIEHGLRNSPLMHGSITYGALSQPTVRDAMHFLARYSSLILAGVDTMLVESDKSAFLIISEKFAFGTIPYFSGSLPPEAVRQSLAEIFVIGYYSAFAKAGVLAGHTVVLHFDAPEPAYFPMYAGRLPPVRFSSDKLGIEFPLALMDSPLLLADPIAARIAEAQCEVLLESMALEDSLIAKVLSVIDSMGYEPHPRLEAIAKRLHVSPRTLKRRLQELGTSYEKLLNRKRQEDCLELLTNPRLSIDAIGQSLGYSSQNNFTRAFRSWAGISPSAYRKRKLDEADLTSPCEVGPLTLRRVSQPPSATFSNSPTTDP